MTRSRKPARNQMQMFSNGEDLPLFSGTAQRGSQERFDPPPAVFQPALAGCRICLDTGKLGDHAFCWCDAGEALRIERRTESKHGDSPPVPLRFQVSNERNVPTEIREYTYKDRQVLISQADVGIVGIVTSDNALGVPTVKNWETIARRHATRFRFVNEL